MGTASLRIFVVDDHEDTRTMFCALLALYGHHVESAASLAEALSSINAGNCDVLISDVGLPDGSGWDLLPKLTPRPRYAISLSGFGGPGDFAASRAAGYQHHLIKPPPMARLQAILDDAARELAEG
jgi:CheY-like chemotaxis protein